MLCYFSSFEAGYILHVTKELDEHFDVTDASRLLLTDICFTLMQIP